MHIKSLEINGFKSYKNLTVIDTFSPGQNTIVGRNGSGKSNVFRAVQFVLGEKQFSNLSHKERTELLHEGSGSNVLSAHVQIVFDNSERRISLDSDEVVLRRTIGLKKDEWFLNNKHVTKSDVVSLLESAGFSRSNPYYIVQQGKVNALCLMKDEQRLELLKEIAGTTVYEERRRSSEAILTDTQQKREKIQGVVAYIEERLNELKGEKDELEAFRSLDRRKRALQYTLFDHEMQAAGHALDTIATDYTQEASKTTALSEELADIRDRIERLESDTSSLAKFERSSERERIFLEAECVRLLKARAAAELRHRDMVEREQLLTDQASLYANELAALNDKLVRTKSQLAKETERMQKLSNAFQENKRKLRALERRRQELEGKQGRSAQFTDQAARDQWLKAQIISVENALTEKEKSRTQLEGSLKDQESLEESTTNELKSLKVAIEAKNESLARDAKDMHDLKKQRDAAANERKNLWRQQQAADRDLEDADQAVSRATKGLFRSLPHQTSAGLESLGGIAQDLGLDRKTQLFGPLFELIRPENETYETALEVAAGAQLTHVVVDCDETAAKLMQELQRRKAGRVTFKPLAQILYLREHQRSGDLNDLEESDHDVVGLENDGNVSADAVPLIRYVNFPVSVKAAVRAVLGKVLLCADAQVASEKRKELNVNCVTLNGEEFNRRGALTGGFYDPRNSKLRAAEVLHATKQRLAKLEAEKGSTAIDIAQADQRVTQLMSKLNKATTNQSYLVSQRDQLQTEIISKQQQLEKLKETKAEVAASLGNCRHGLKELEEQKTGYQDELATPMLDALSAEEQNEMATVKKRTIELKQEQESCAKELADVNVLVKDLETEIEQNLMKRKDELLTSMGRKHRKVAMTNGSMTLKNPTKSKRKSASQQRKQKTKSGISDDEDEMGDAGDEYDDEEPNPVDLQQIDWVKAKCEEFGQDLETANTRLDDAKSHLSAMEKETTRVCKKAMESRVELTEAKNHEEQLIEELAASEEQLDKLQTKRSLQVEKRELGARKIRELGSLSTDELKKVSNGEYHASRYNSKSLMNEIKKTNESLQNYSHVNKKALDQYLSFSDRREALLERKQELDDAEKSIVELIKHLDIQKDQDIIRTFRQVSKNFRDVFTELVPNGKGELVMVASKGGNRGNSQDASSSANDDMEHIVEEFVGISPRVSFTGNAGETQLLMKQLSGGQRALVALTLIFAIQRCDPAPFYLFDEIDSALDSSYRTTVAALVRRQSKNAQFITTTFRPELVQTADICFGVNFQNKISSVQPIKKDEASNFVEITVSNDRNNGANRQIKQPKTTTEEKETEDSVDHHEKPTSVKKQRTSEETRA